MDPLMADGLARSDLPPFSARRERFYDVLPHALSVYDFFLRHHVVETRGPRQSEFDLRSAPLRLRERFSETAADLLSKFAIEPHVRFRDEAVDVRQSARDEGAVAPHRLVVHLHQIIALV